MFSYNIITLFIFITLLVLSQQCHLDLIRPFMLLVQRQCRETFPSDGRRYPETGDVTQ